VNLSYCRVCQGRKYVLHSTTVSLPIHLWPLESIEDHLLEDAGLYICQECGHVQLQTQDELFTSSLYSEGSCVEDNLGMKKERLEIMRSVLGKDLFVQKRVLDIGGGHNPFVGMLPESETWIVDIDPDEESQKFADHVVPERFEEVDLPGAYFDIIISFHTFEHLPDPAHVVRQIAQVMKPGGIVIIEVPNLSGIIESMPSYAIFHQHMSLFTSATMDQLFERYGFQRKTLLRKDSVILVAYEKAGDPHRTFPRCEESIQLATKLRTRLKEIRVKLEQSMDGWGSKSLGFYGAGGSTTLFLANYPFLRDRIEIAFDRDERKHGRYIPGSGIQVNTPEDIDTAPIDTLLFLDTTLYEQLYPKLSKKCINLEKL